MENTELVYFRSRLAVAENPDLHQKLLSGSFREQICIGLLLGASVTRVNETDLVPGVKGPRLVEENK